MQTLIYTLTVK